MRIIIAYIAAALAALGTASTAGAHRTHHGYPAYWLRQAACIRHYESRDEWHIPDGAYQIIPSTWHSFKPPSWPDRAENNSPPRQTFVAWRDWVHNGRSWGANNQWPNTARACGVR